MVFLVVLSACNIFLEPKSEMQMKSALSQKQCWACFGYNQGLWSIALLLDSYSDLTGGMQCSENPLWQNRILAQSLTWWALGVGNVHSLVLPFREKSHWNLTFTCGGINSLAIMYSLYFYNLYLMFKYIQVHTVCISYQFCAHWKDTTFWSPFKVWKPKGREAFRRWIPDATLNECMEGCLKDFTFFFFCINWRST